MSNKIQIKTENMAQLSAYRSKLREKPRLTYLFVELTDECNMSCFHCGSSCGQNNGTYIDFDLLIKCLRDLAEDYSSEKVMICLTGGEPLLYHRFFDVVDEINKCGFVWGITTNGSLIDEITAQRLKKSGVGSVVVSLDGKEETHEWFRNSKGSYKSAITAINNLQSVGISTQITTVVHKKNIGELDEIYATLCDMGAVSWRIINIEPIGRTLQHENLLLNKQELMHVLEYIRDKRFSRNVNMDVRYGCSHYLSFEYEREVRDNYFICGAGINTGSILCNGDIYGCLDIERRKELVQGNIGRDRFYDVWINGFKNYRIDRSMVSEVCRDCKEKCFCGADSMHTWDFDNNKPKICILKDDLYV